MAKTKLGKLKWMQFEDTDNTTIFKAKNVDNYSEEKLCKFINKNEGKIEIVSISCRWSYPTTLFYREIKQK